MMQPHWLDEVFESPDLAAKEFLNHSRFRDALANAQQAFKEAKAELERHPHNIGCVPAQQARVAFLDAINAN